VKKEAKASTKSESKKKIIGIQKKDTQPSNIEKKNVKKEAKASTKSEAINKVDPQIKEEAEEKDPQIQEEAEENKAKIEATKVEPVPGDSEGLNKQCYSFIWENLRNIYCFQKDLSSNLEIAIKNYCKQRDDDTMGKGELPQAFDIELMQSIACSFYESGAIHGAELGGTIGSVNIDEN